MMRCHRHRHPGISVHTVTLGPVRAEPATVAPEVQAEPVAAPGTHRIVIGDVREGLRSLPEGSVRCCVTSPPYWGLRDYGADGQIGLEQSPDEYVAQMVEVFREVRRVLADDGTLWLNLGDSYAAPVGGQNSFTSSTLSGGRGKRDPLHTTRTRHRSGVKVKDLVGIPWRVAVALRADGWYLRSDIIWAKPNPMPESITDRPTKSHEYIFLLAKSQRYYFDAQAVREASVGRWNSMETFGTARPKAAAANTDLQRTQFAHTTHHDDRVRTGRHVRSVWTIATQPYADAHFAAFPEALPERCIRAGSAVGDTVLDPFAGSGTTLLVACRLGRNAVGCELNPAYAAMAERRIGAGLRPATFRDTSKIESGGLFV